VLAGCSGLHAQGMNDHPYESLPAFALGALDTNEAHQVFAHVAACPTCRDDVELWVAIVALLPYAAPPSDPPAHIKRRLFALVDAVAAAPEPRPPRPSAAGWLRPANVVASGALALALVFGVLLIGMRQRVDLLTAGLATRDQQMQFMSAATAHQFAPRQPAVGATMYIKPSEPHALLVLRNLKPLAEGKVYQLWFAKAGHQLPSNIFTVDSAGMAMVEVDASAPVDQYDLVMVTVEPVGGSPAPSQDVVFQAEL
jgi:anti-sigma-K factor RskA